MLLYTGGLYYIHILDYQNSESGMAVTVTVYKLYYTNNNIWTQSELTRKYARPRDHQQNNINM